MPDENEVEEEESVEGIDDEEIVEAVKHHLTEEFDVPKRVVQNPMRVDWVPPPNGKDNSRVIRAAQNAGTIGFRVATTAMKQRITQVIILAGVIAGPTWFGASQFYGVQISALEADVLELQEENEELIQEVEDLEEERLEALRARAGE